MTTEACPKTVYVSLCTLCFPTGLGNTCLMCSLFGVLSGQPCGTLEQRLTMPPLYQLISAMHNCLTSKHHSVATWEGGCVGHVWHSHSPPVMGSGLERGVFPWLLDPPHERWCALGGSFSRSLACWFGFRRCTPGNHACWTHTSKHTNFQPDLGGKDGVGAGWQSGVWT